MENPMSAISNPQNNLPPYPDHPSLSLAVHNINGASQVDPPQNGQLNGTENAELPVKRRPGRPKGSTKKNLLGESPMSPKIKRPVGRPRKDGFPAGSVGPARSRPKREKPNSLSGVGYPPMNIYGSISAPPIPYIHIDPRLGGSDDWANLARNDPNQFLGTLLTALAAPNPVSSAGPSVEEAFKSHLVSLAPNPSQMQPIPSLYSILKTFWLPSSPSYFSLTASASTARTPSEHRFLYWDPQPLVFNGISCPNCSSPLINRGRISSGPIKVYDIEKPFFIIGCEYICKSPQCVSATDAEGRKFASTDSSILRSLPSKLQDEFPARLLYSDTDAGSGENIWNWKALGVSLSLWNMVQGALRTGIKKEVILHLIHCVQYGVTEEEGEHKEEEEEAEEEESGEGQQMHVDAPSVEGVPADEHVGSSFADAYSTAWKENTAVTDNTNDAVNGAPSKAPVSSSSTTGPSATQSTGPTPASQAFAAFGAYPFTPGYAFFPAPPPNPNGTVVMGSPPNPAAGGVASASPTANSNGAPDSDGTAQEGSKTRSPRHCCKCGSQDCKGKGGRNFCMNPCQDCGKLDCKGRNSRRPDKKCSDGWA